MRKQNIMIALASGLLLSACSTAMTTLNAGAQNVAVVLNVSANCQRLGEIDGYKRNEHGDLSLQAMRNSAKNDLKNKAHAIGADTLLITSSEGLNANGGYYTARGFYGVYNEGFYVPYSYVKEYHIEAIAYKCGNERGANAD